LFYLYNGRLADPLPFEINVEVDGAGSRFLIEHEKTLIARKLVKPNNGMIWEDAVRGINSIIETIQNPPEERP